MSVPKQFNSLVLRMRWHYNTSCIYDLRVWLRVKTIEYRLSLNTNHWKSLKFYNTKVTRIWKRGKNFPWQPCFFPDQNEMRSLSVECPTNIIYTSCIYDLRVWVVKYKLHTRERMDIIIKVWKRYYGWVIVVERHVYYLSATSWTVQVTFPFFQVK
jgi:hypothetical protein